MIPGRLSPWSCPTRTGRTGSGSGGSGWRRHVRCWLHTSGLRRAVWENILTAEEAAQALTAALRLPVAFVPDDQLALNALAWARRLDQPWRRCAVPSSGPPTAG